VCRHEAGILVASLTTPLIPLSFSLSHTTHTVLFRRLIAHYRNTDVRHSCNIISVSKIPVTKLLGLCHGWKYRELTCHLYYFLKRYYLEVIK
jgi:hypothetical protein